VVGHPSPVFPPPKDLKLFRLRRIDDNLLPSNRVLKVEVERSQEQSLSSQKLMSAGVDLVSQDGMIHLSHVTPELVGPAGHRLQLDRREPINVETPRVLNSSPAGQT